MAKIPAEIMQLEEERKAAQENEKGPLALPQGLNAPYGYRITKTSTYIVTEKDDGNEETREIAPAGLYIATRARDINTGHEKWQINVTRGDDQKFMLIDRGTAQHATKLVELAAYGLPVNSVNSREIVKYLAAYEATNYKALPTALTSAKMGWQSTGGYLLGTEYYTTGRENVTFEPEDDNTRGLAKAFTAKGNIDEWLQIIKRAMLTSKHAQLAFYAAFIPPLLEVYGCPNFILDFAHRTSKGKTTTLRIAASVIGVPDEKQEQSALSTWDATPIYIERHLSAINGLPFIVDDTKRAKRPEDVARVLYTAAQGRGKGRGRPNGIAQTGTWRTVTISSGEQPATSFTNDGGTRGRVLTITGSPFPDGSSKLVNSLNSGLLEHYGHGYAVVIPWLVENIEDRKDEWKRSYTSWRDHFTGKSTDNVGSRLAAYMAAIYTTAEIVHIAFDELGHPLPWYRQDFDDIWETIIEEAGDELGDQEALKATLAWATTNSNRFEGREDGNSKLDLLGKWDTGDDWQYIAIRQTAIAEFLSKNGHSPRQVFDAWKRNGYLDRPPTRRGFDTNIRLKGITVAGFIKIKREAFDILLSID